MVDDVSRATRTKLPDEAKFDHEGEVFGEPGTTIQTVAIEIAADRLVRGFLRCLQFENRCDLTGEPCREVERCGCCLELKGWCSNEQI